jgi:2-oxoisovalerate dehydrogenase E1 component
MAHDSIVICNFGDASANHASAQTAINAACWTAYQQVPLPLMFVCEDNGIGISTRTPKGWITANFSQRPGLTYFYCDGRDLLDTYRVSKQAADYARRHRKPVFYILQNEAQDPVLVTAQQIIEAKLLTPQGVIDLYHELKARITAIAMQVIHRPKLQTAEQAMAAIVPPKLDPKQVPTTPLSEDDYKALMIAD